MLIVASDSRERKKSTPHFESAFKNKYDIIVRPHQDRVAFDRFD